MRYKQQRKVDGKVGRSRMRKLAKIRVELVKAITVIKRIDKDTGEELAQHASITMLRGLLREAKSKQSFGEPKA